MPNWCENYVVIDGNPATLKQLVLDIKKQQEIQQAKYDKKGKDPMSLANADWVRNLFARYNDKKADDEHGLGNINIRGTILEIDDSDQEFLAVYFDTAWCGTVEGFNNYLINEYKDISISYAYEVESGCGVFNEYGTGETDKSRYHFSLINEKTGDEIFVDGDEDLICDYVNDELHTKYKNFKEIENAETKKGAEVNKEEFDFVILPVCDYVKNKENSIKAPEEDIEL